MSTEDPGRLASPSSAQLGQLPKPGTRTDWHHDGYGLPAYTAEQMHAYAAQEVAAERERCGQVYGSREVAMTAELGRLRAELADALHAMRAYARENPRHEYQGATQDPNGVHAWLARNDRA